jgi:hypothetical protein
MAQRTHSRTLQMDWGFDSNPLKGSVQPRQQDGAPSLQPDGEKEEGLFGGRYGADRPGKPAVDLHPEGTGGTGINFVVGAQRGLMIQSIVPGGPASRAIPHPDDKHLFPPNATGAEVLQNGDVLYKVDGRDVLDLKVPAVAPLLRGPLGSTVEITVMRQKDGAGGEGGAVPALLRATVVRGLLPQEMPGGDQLAVVSSHKPAPVILASQVLSETSVTTDATIVSHSTFNSNKQYIPTQLLSGKPKEPK